MDWNNFKLHMDKLRTDLMEKLQTLRERISSVNDMRWVLANGYSLIRLCYTIQSDILALCTEFNKTHMQLETFQGSLDEQKLETDYLMIIISLAISIENKLNDISHN